AALTSDATYIFVPASTVADAFSYTNSDGFGGTSVAAVLIGVDTNAYGQATGVVLGTNSTAVVSFAGIPGYAYQIQRATNVDFSGTLRLWTTNAPSHGVFDITDDFSDLPAPPSQAFYRLLSQ